MASITLEERIARIRAVPGVAVRVAPAVAVGVADVVREHAARGEDPYGRAWPPTAKGERPLRRAGDAVRASSSGPVAIVRVVGVEALHDQGRARGGVRRQILPSRSLPADGVAAVDAAVNADLARVLKGAR